MSETQINYALTNKARVKDRIGLSTNNLDVVLDRIIAGVTDFLEGECGGRRFLETTYTYETQTIFNDNQRMLAVKHPPIGTATAVQYRAGLKSNPNWTDFNTNDWEVVNDGGSGLVAIAGIPTGVNLIRISYTGGYKIDFANFGSATHTLPSDITDLAERLVIKLFKRRESEGRLSETFNGSTVQFADLIDKADRDIINRYRRVPQFI